MDDEGVLTMRQAFTHWSANYPNMSSEFNYEMFELLGDNTFNKVLIWYMWRRFRFDLNKDFHAHATLTNATKVYKSKHQMPLISDFLELPKMAIYRSLFYHKQKKTHADRLGQIMMDLKMKTDILEAFIGGLEFLIDSKFCFTIGCSIIYNILSSYFDSLSDMTIDPARVLPNKVKLKEIMDKFDRQEKFHFKEHELPDDYFTLDLTLHFKDQPLYNSNKQLITFKKFTAGPAKNKKMLEDELCLLFIHWFEDECGIVYSCHRGINVS